MTPEDDDTTTVDSQATEDQGAADQPAEQSAADQTAEGSGSATSDTGNIREPNENETTAIDAAETERASALTRALQLIDALLGKRPADDTDGGSGAPEITTDDQRVIDAAGRWLLTPQVNSTFWDTLSTARDLVAKNQALNAAHHIDTTKNDYAYVYGLDTVDKGLFFGMPFFNTNSNCRREVVTHEYFHFLGLGHFYSTTTTGEALQCAHHMAELVFDIATGCTLGCESAVGSCRP